jgi:hypothetical protein
MTDYSAGGFFGPENAGMLWAITFGIGLVLYAFWIFIQWKIFAKAGFPGALALINLAVFIPFVGFLAAIGLQVWFAFADWPALKK